MNEYDHIKGTFFAECAELLAQLETRLATLESDGSAALSADSDLMNAIFRAVHSIKAGAGAFKFSALVEFSHKYEAMLDGMRDGRIPVVDDGIALLFRATDILADLVAAAENGVAVPGDFTTEVAMELAKIVNAAATDAGEDTNGADANSDDTDTAPKSGDETQRQSIFRITFEPSAQLFQHANEPLLLVREMQTLGSVEARIDLGRLPPLHKLDPEDTYFSWIFELCTEANQASVEEVFEFVVDDCRLEIELLGEPENETKSAETSAVATTEAEADDPDAGGNKARASDSAPADGKQIATQNGPQSGIQAATPGAAKASTIRVDLDRIDRLVNMVGELVITQSMLSQQTSELPTDQFPAIVRGLEELAFHTRELQENVMAIRMQPVKSVFTRMPRLVRDLSSKLGKKVKLRTIGENTEVDKTVIEEISDPITHMIRNSLDHGLEDAAERKAAGKPEEGNIILSAEHRGGRIVITIQDDGAGIKRDLVLKRARERGLVDADATPSDEEIDNLIFAPGFSTAEKVTDVSGRGVGMDVVRRNIQSLGGRVAIHSTPGKGTTFTMTLPLTLAVMDGMVVEVGGEKFVVPVTNIIESIRPDPSDIHRLPSGQELVAIRGEYISLVYLYGVFNISGAVSNPSKGLVVLAETEKKGKIGIVVDALLGQQQVVIKSLESNYDPVPGISAVTILGNGMVAPILDADGLRKMAGISAAIQLPPNGGTPESNGADEDQTAESAVPDQAAHIEGQATLNAGSEEQQTAME